MRLVEIRSVLSPEFLEQLDPHITPLVNALNRAGFRTYGSCEGHIGKTQNSPSPWVSFHERHIMKEQIATLEKILTLFNKQNTPTNFNILKPT